MDAVIEKIDALQEEAERVDSERTKHLSVCPNGTNTAPPSKKSKRASNAASGGQLLNSSSPSTSNLRGYKVLVYHHTNLSVLVDSLYVNPRSIE